MRQLRLGCYVYAIIILSYFYFWLDPAINKTGDCVYRPSLSWFANRNWSARSSPGALSFNQTLTMKMLRFIQPVLLLASCITAFPFKVKAAQILFKPLIWFIFRSKVSFDDALENFKYNHMRWKAQGYCNTFAGGFTLAE